MNPRTVEEVISDFKGRRAGIIKALTKDAEDFYQLCNPNFNHLVLCLYAFPNQQWEVNLPPASELPEPRSGINFLRDSMSKKDWLCMVALHSDAWLHAVATYFAAKFKFDKADRKRLFNKITDVPSISEIMEGKSMKRSKMESCGLPTEILEEEVLARLPVRDLLRYRLVCKKWCSLIDDPEFVSTHLKKFKNNSDESQLLVVERPKSWLKSEQVLVRRSDTFRKVMELDHYAGHRDSSHAIISYVNGLVLVRKGNFRGFCGIKLWNPSMNTSFDVPDTAFQSMRYASCFELGLGYDASCNDHKVVAFVYPQAEVKYDFAERYRATIPGLIQVYSLRTNSWTTKLGAPPYWSNGKQVFVNGAIHWTNFGPNIPDGLPTWYMKKDYSHIVSFDVRKEVLSYMELPRNMINEVSEPIKEKFPTVLDDSLAMFYAYGSYIDIWIMKEYGVAESWSRCYKFSLQFDNLLYFKNNGELLFALDGRGMKSYDVKKKWVRDLAKTYSKSSKYTIYNYVESLVLSKGVNRNKQPLVDLSDGN